MLRWFAGFGMVAWACLSLTLAANAGEVQGKFKQANTKDRKISIVKDGKTVTLPYDRAIEVFTVIKPAKKKQKPQNIPYAGGVNALKSDADVTLITETQDGEETVIMVQVGSAVEETKPKNKNKKNKKKKKK